MIHFFHGFLGSKRDFEFMKSEQVLLHDLYQEIPKTNHSDVLIGYSMGGRLAMELALRNGFKKLILINAHPGLENDAEKEARSDWEKEVLERLGDPGAFLDWWNALPIFKYDRPLKVIPNGSSDLFRKMLLSKQENFLPFLLENKDRVHWILGENDPKYSALAVKLSAFDVHLVPGGHRLFQHPDILKQIINEILE